MSLIGTKQVWFVGSLWTTSCLVHIQRGMLVPGCTFELLARKDTRKHQSVVTV